ncbi:quinone oxidoreductase family protein [Henriciella aquimarina]|uniref:quinone oxidoreductase family protein n=1 Tax=Henriciella aquimarina TaxID=545261 RepID=UPI0009FEFE53|nr:quinone oxidoreductase [Henriciella aquimarina]
MSDAYCIQINKTGGPEVLETVAMEPRRPGPGEVLVRQSAVGLNFADTYQRSGLYPVKTPAVLGSEGAGTVEAVGDGVENLKPGDRVAYLGSGTYATHFTGPASRMMRLPDAISEDDAAAVLLKGLTAWMLLFEVYRASPGESALIWAPSGGVGSLLVPWATSLGLRVIAVTSTEEKAEMARKAGAAEVIFSHEDVAGRARALTGGKGVDVSYDSVGKVSAKASLDSLKPRGWFVTYGNASGAVEPIAPVELSQRGSLVMVRPSLFHFIDTEEGLRKGAAAVFGALRAGTLKPKIGQTFPLKQAADAHRAIESGKTKASTLLKP